MSEIEQAINGVLCRGNHSAYDEERLRNVVDDLLNFGCKNVADKLLEARAAQRGRLEDLLGELRLVRLLARHLSTPIHLQTGDAPDARFTIDGCECLLEIVHKSSHWPLSEAFASHHLNSLLETLPITVQPYVAAAFLKPQVGWKERADQEKAVDDLASWLVAQLPAAVAAGRQRLDYTDSKTHFLLSAIDAPPGYMRGHASIEAWLSDEGTLRHSIEKKNEKASERLAASSADVYLVGLAIDNAWLCRGRDLLTTLLGPMVQTDHSLGGGSYRPVPATRISRVERARQQGRTEWLDLACFDPSKNALCGFPEAVFLDPASEHVGGVLAIYHTEELQFVPNPFSLNSSERLRSRFPLQLTPFVVNGSGS